MRCAETIKGDFVGPQEILERIMQEFTCREVSPLNGLIRSTRDAGVLLMGIVKFYRSP